MSPEAEVGCMEGESTPGGCGGPQPPLLSPPLQPWPVRVRSLWPCGGAGPRTPSAAGEGGAGLSAVGSPS